MGSPISPVLADLVMEEIKETAISTFRHPPKWWFRYVDDSHSCLKKDEVDEFHKHLNSINPNIQFTLELENSNGQGLPFLDTITSRRDTEEGLPGVLGNKGTLAKYRREQGNISQFLGTGEQNSKNYSTKTF